MLKYVQRIKDLREQRGLKQEDIARILNTTQQYYGQYELNKRPLPIEHLITLSQFYQVSTDYILGLKDTK